jgi:hypothetical protein
MAMFERFSSFSQKDIIINMGLKFPQKQGVINVHPFPRNTLKCNKNMV